MTSRKQQRIPTTLKAEVATTIRKSNKTKQQQQWKIVEKKNRKDNSSTIAKHERNIRRIPTFSIKGQWRIEDVFECKKNHIIS